MPSSETLLIIDWRDICRQTLAEAACHYARGNHVGLQVAIYEADRVLNIALENYLKETHKLNSYVWGASDPGGHWPFHELIDAFVHCFNPKPPTLQVEFIKRGHNVRNECKSGQTPPKEMVAEFLEVTSLWLSSLNVDVSEVEKILREVKTP